MSALLDATLAHLDALVAFDSTNPPRRPDALVEHLTTVLGEAGLAIALEDHGDGCVSVRATRGPAGAARVLFNAHVDTVPVAAGWTRDPFALALDEVALAHGGAPERVAYALGAADVKGGAAAMLAAALATDAPCALLFTTDEEAGRAICMTHEAARLGRFADAHADVLPYALAVVAEPTRAAAVLAHRGVATGSLAFAGRAAHSSSARGESAVHALGLWMADALRVAADDDARPPGPSGLVGLRLNVGRIAGGTKPNVIAAEAEARFGVRPPPERDARAVLRELAALAPADVARFEPAFFGPALPASAALGGAAETLAGRLGLPLGPAVDFWTEAALLSSAGLPALVLGPGDIAQAHGADEYVRTSELARAAELYLAILERAPALAPATRAPAARPDGRAS